MKKEKGIGVTLWKQRRTRRRHKKTKLRLSQLQKKSLIERYEDFLVSGKPSAKIVPILLALVAAPGLLAVAVALPGLVSLLDSFSIPTNTRVRPLCYKAIARAKTRGLVNVREKKGVQYYILTQKGEEVLYGELLKGVTLTPQKKWDRLWRVVIFDFPVEINFARDIFRKKLREWNFQQLQESVFLSPWPCFHELALLREALGAEHHVLLLELVFLEDEAHWRKYFKI